jgi:NAD(P)-dependent dehydrogenase (short-subunit alcohol dehydrogenase family)/predicted MFS family arabinose efflux permease
MTVRSGIWTFALLATIQATFIAAITMLSVPLPTIRRDLGLSTSDLALAGCACGLSFSGLLPLGGRLADRWSPRRALLVAIAVFVGGCGFVALADGPVVLVLGRLAQGAGAALGAPAALASVAPHRLRLWGVLAGSGAAAGVLAGGLAGSWRWLFAGAGLVMLGAAILVRHRLPAHRPVVRAPLGVPGTLLATAGLGALCYGLVRGSPPYLAAGLAALAAYGWTERRTPLVPWRMFATPVRLTALLLTSLTAAAMASTFYFLSLHLQQAHGYSPAATSLAFLPTALVMTVAGPMLSRWSAPVLLPLGAALTGLALLVLSRTGVDTPYLGATLAGLLLLPIGAALTFGEATVAVLRGVPAERAGTAAGVLNLAMELGPAIGLAALVAVAGAVSPFTVAGLALLLGALSAVLIQKKWSKPVGQRFIGKVALVTGGGSGIGRATARALAREGATVVVAARDSAALAGTVELITDDGGAGTAVPTDVTNADQVRALVDAIVERFGGLDVAVNCAGALGGPAPLADLAEPVWDMMLATNLTGVFHSLKYEIRQMRGRGGTIVNVSSNLGAHGRRPGIGAYVAAKAAVSSLTRNTALEYIGEGVRINAVSPGPSDTAMSLRPGETPDDRATRLASALPIGRVGTLDEITSAILWLSSDESGFTVGADLVVDGGATA